MQFALSAARGTAGVAAIEAEAALSKLPKPVDLGVTVVAATGQLALVSTVATVATSPPTEIVTRADTRLLHADDDLWLLRGENPRITLRSLERRVVTLLLAAYDKPDVCPAAIRLAGAPNVDAVFAARIRGLLSDPRLLDPLCKRERQFRLAEEARGSPLPFTNGLFVHPRDRLTPNVGGKAALLLQAMNTADEAWDPRALGEGLPVLLSQLAYEDAVFARAVPPRTQAPAASSSPTPSSVLAAVLQRLGAPPEATHEACALSAALAQSLDPTRFLAELVAAYTVEHFPAEPRRSAALALLYALSEVEVPSSAAAVPSQLAKLLASAQPRPSLCDTAPQPPIIRAISKPTLEFLTNQLDRSHYIRY